MDILTISEKRAFLVDAEKYCALAIRTVHGAMKEAVALAEIEPRMSPSAESAIHATLENYKHVIPIRNKTYTIRFRLTTYPHLAEPNGGKNYA